MTHEKKKTRWTLWLWTHSSCFRAANERFISGIRLSLSLSQCLLAQCSCLFDLYWPAIKCCLCVLYQKMEISLRSQTQSRDSTAVGIQPRMQRRYNRTMKTEQKLSFTYLRNGSRTWTLLRFSFSFKSLIFLFWPEWPVWIRNIH